MLLAAIKNSIQMTNISKPLMIYCPYVHRCAVHPVVCTVVVVCERLFCVVAVLNPPCEVMAGVYVLPNKKFLI